MRNMDNFAGGDEEQMCGDVCGVELETSGDSIDISTELGGVFFDTLGDGSGGISGDRVCFEIDDIGGDWGLVGVISDDDTVAAPVENAGGGAEDEGHFIVYFELVRIVVGVVFF